MKISRILGISVVLAMLATVPFVTYFTVGPRGVLDIGKLVREHQHQARVEAIKRAAPTNQTGVADENVADDINHTPKEQLPPVIHILQSTEMQTPAGK
ncbi:MAG: hypothetical protein KBD27_03580 [Candidatus Moranbacteria bacterium]|nr:hypothetical protein [Candidatus Moranbacteria bacterium]